MKKIFAFNLIISISILPLFGCFNAIPEMSEEEEKMVVRYMADAVLQADVSYQSRLLDEEEKEAALEEEARREEELKKIEEENKIKEEKKKAENTPDSHEVTQIEVTHTDKDIAAFLGLEGVEFTYAGFESAGTYPTDVADLGFGYSAHENTKLLIVSFDLYNVTDNDLDINIAGLKARFRIIVNGEERYTPDFVPLNTVLTMYSDTLGAGQKQKLDLIYEVPEDLNVNTLDIQITTQSKDQMKFKLQ